MPKKAPKTAINGDQPHLHQTLPRRSPRFLPSPLPTTNKPKSNKHPKNPSTTHNRTDPPTSRRRSRRISSLSAVSDRSIELDATILPGQQEPPPATPINKTHLGFTPDCSVAVKDVVTLDAIAEVVSPIKKIHLGFSPDSALGGSRPRRVAAKDGAVLGTIVEVPEMEVSPIKKIHLGFSPDSAVCGSRPRRVAAKDGAVLGTIVEVPEMEVSPIKKIHLGFSPDSRAEASRGRRRSSRLAAGLDANAGVGKKEASPIKKMHLGFSPDSVVEASRRSSEKGVDSNLAPEVRQVKKRVRGRGVKGAVKVLGKGVDGGAKRGRRKNGAALDAATQARKTELSPVDKIHLGISLDSAVESSRGRRPLSEKRVNSNAVSEVREVKKRGRRTGVKGDGKVLRKADANVDGVEGAGKRGRRKNGSPPKKMRKIEENCGAECALVIWMKEQEKAGSGIREGEECDGVKEWTKDQESALQRAYLSAKPSPHFWKKVSKMVPGKTAQDCFDRVHADCATPQQPQPRSRTNKVSFSPIANFTLPGTTTSSGYTVPKAKRLTSNKKKNLVALKTARHLLQKHCLADQSQEADLFSVLETSPVALSPSFPDIGSPASTNCILSPPSVLQQCSERSSSAQKRLPSRSKSRLRPEHASPEVLKQIKNIALHVKYIDVLHCREAKRRASSKTPSSQASTKSTTNEVLADVGVARTALISEARDVISQFKLMQANPCENLEDLDTDDGDDDANINDEDDEDEE